MSTDYWQKQTTDPLYPDVLWSKPESKGLAGKLLIIGGNAHGFSTVSNALLSAQAAGIGDVQVLVPDSLRRVLEEQPFINDFLPSGAGGGFAKSAKSSLLASAHWADASWLSGDFGKGSEVTLLIENLLEQDLRLCLSGDSLEHIADGRSLLDRAGTLLMCDFKQLQKLLAPLGVSITSVMGVVQLVEHLHDVTSTSQAHIAVTVEDKVLLAVDGQVVSVPLIHSWGPLVVWWLQFPNKPLEALSSGAWEASESGAGGGT